MDAGGAIAADRNNMDVLVYAPKGWAFRGRNGVDVSSQQQFKARFL